MRSQLHVKIVLLSVIALSLGMLWGLSQRRDNAYPRGERKPRPYPVWIRNFTASTYEGNRLLARIRADEFKINPRRFFVFNIKPLNEATLSNVRIDLHIYSDGPPDAEGFSFSKGLPLVDGKGMPAVEGTGLVTRGVIEGLILMVYRAGTPSMVVKAGRGFIDFKRKETAMQRVSMKDVSSGRIIRSPSVIWKDKEKVFDVPGEYVATTPYGQARGRGIKVDLDFVVSPLKHTDRGLSNHR